MSSGGVERRRERWVMPAALMRVWIAGKERRMWSQVAGEATSPVMVVWRCGFGSGGEGVRERRRSGVEEKRCAIACPMPREAPVMRICGGGGIM